MDFIGTIAQESMWDSNAVWDSGRAFWLCQINNIYNPETQNEYIAMESDYDRIEKCKQIYDNYIERGRIKTWLKGYNRRENWISKMWIVCQ
jgi:hypothetical protein